MASHSHSKPPDENPAARAASDLDANRDHDIVQLLRSGQAAPAFDLIMQRYQTKVYRLCIAYLRTPAPAQDAAQDSLIRVWRALPKYDGRAALSTWIYAITRNGCFTALRARRPQLSLSDAAIGTEVDLLKAADLNEPSHRQQALRQLVDELPDITRRIVTLYYFDDQSIADVSALIGLPDGTIKTHLYRARARLRERLHSLGLADPARWLTEGEHHAD